MVSRVLITGGAGFIGSHIADELLARGYEVRVLDNLLAQVHGETGRWPAYLAREVEAMRGDLRDGSTLAKALRGVDAVVHLGAMVGVGQSMYRVDDYISVNDLGTATLLQALIARPVSRLVVASSMSVYGEGLYHDGAGRPVEDASRAVISLERGMWDPAGPDGEPLTPQPTPEWKRPSLESVYALTKYSQERLCLLIGQAYRIPTTALRLFNVFGARQALSNPYTGVLAIFAARLLNGRRPMIFEDGLQRRDFVDVRDVAHAFRLALETPALECRTLNVGSGCSLTVREVADALARLLGRGDLEPEITGRARTGDIRHCYADINRIGDVLGFEPRINFKRGLEDLVAWLESQVAIDRVEEASRELHARGLVA